MCEIVFYETNAGQMHSEKTLLPNGRYVKFLQNTKSENPKYTVKIFDEDGIENRMGSIPKEEINMLFKALKQLSTAYEDKITFLSRSKVLISGDFLILGLKNENEFERALQLIYEEFN